MSSKLRKTNLSNFQRNIVNQVLRRKKCGVFLPMGAGKTIIALTAMRTLIKRKQANKVLVVAPLRVAKSQWLQEASKWSHSSKLDISLCVGNEKQRVAGLTRKADVYVVSVSNIIWLCLNFKLSFDVIVLDESTAFKGFSSKRVKALIKALQIGRVPDYMWLLSGTPSPNSLAELFTQMFFIDVNIFGKKHGAFMNRYFVVDGRKAYLKEGSEEKIHKRIKPYCFTSHDENAVDYPVAYRDELIEPSQEQVATSEKIENELFLMLKEGNVEVKNAGVLVGKLHQLAQGFIYTQDAEGNRTGVHNLNENKVAALKEIVADNPNENILVAYNFTEEKERIMRSFPQAVKLGRNGDEVDAWNEGKIKMLLCHSRSASHGLNLQYGGNILVWTSLPFSLETYEQMNARLPRRGQKKRVVIVRLITENSMDKTTTYILNRRSVGAKSLLQSIYLDLSNKRT